MLCAHRLSWAPSQPNQRWKRASTTVGVLRSTSSSPKPRARASWKWRNGAWQVAQSTEPVPESRGSKKSFSPSAMASRLPDTRLVGSGASGGGQGPWRRILAISSFEKSTSEEIRSVLVRRSVAPPAVSSNASSQRPGMWNMRPSARQRPGPSAFTLGA